MSTNQTLHHPVVNAEEWLRASQDFLVKEKEFTRRRDEISKLRRDLPWVLVDKDYTFEGPEGKRTLSELFGNKSQLIVYHFMFAPRWEEGCSGCSFVSDHFDGARMHFEHHDIAFVAISRAPYQEFMPFKERMGWTFPWLSSAGNDFNYDFGVSFHRQDLDAGPVMYNFKVQPIKSEELPGLSVFVKDEDGKVYRTYSSYDRGLDLLIGAYNFIDLTPVGRNEAHGMDWMRFHDRYED